MALPGPSYAGGIPAIDITGKIVIIPTDGGDTYYTYDRDLQWAYRRRTILHPTAEEIAAGKKDFPVITWKYSFATCQLDEMVYTYDTRTGNIIKFDPVTRKGELVNTLPNSNNSAGRVMFHPVEKEVLYIAMERGAIYIYNIITEEFKLLAGTMGVRGSRDGPFEDALFGDIGQILFDENNDIILVDSYSHCVRKLDMKNRIATTLIGKIGVNGHQDGNPEDALFNGPYGICIDKRNNNIYIADMYNHCIRKLVVQ
jgi:WD40 repeat protein